MILLKIWHQGIKFIWYKSMNSGSSLWHKNSMDSCITSGKKVSLLINLLFLILGLLFNLLRLVLMILFILKPLDLSVMPSIKIQKSRVIKINLGSLRLILKMLSIFSKIIINISIIFLSFSLLIIFLVISLLNSWIIICFWILFPGFILDPCLIHLIIKFSLNI